MSSYVNYSEICYDIDIGECMSNTCIHGTCNDEVIGFMCNCHDGYTGSLCEIGGWEDVM